MSGHGEKLTRRMEAAIAALVTEPTAEAAAARAGVSPATLRRWQGRALLQHAYRLARQAVLEESVARLVKAAVKATDKLERLLDSRKPAVQLRAAVAILDRPVRGVQLCDFEARIRALESPTAPHRNTDHFAESNGQT